MFFVTHRAFCNPADVEEFTKEKKELLLGKCQRSAVFIRAVQEIVDCYEKLEEKNQVNQLSLGGALNENTVNGDLSATNAIVPDATHSFPVKSSNSSRLKDEPDNALEDVGALTEVESLWQSFPSEENTSNTIATS